MKEDNMLKITTDGRKAALDIRLVDPTAKVAKDCKIYQCAQNVKDIYFKFYSDGGTQLVFCDSSTPKQSFNAYDEMKRLLIGFGIKDSEISFVHDATTDAQREQLFERMRNSEIRVLIGSTWKLGMGVNIQDRLVAIHHLDVPWRPADMVQREGRILRPGNLNKEVYIYRYITEGTFDAYSWQLLETKQRFISKLLAGSIKTRINKDVGDTVLNYAEVKALAVGNPLIKSRVEAFNELSRLLTLKQRSEELKTDMLHQIETLPNYIEVKEEEIDNCLKDIEFYSANKVSYTRDELKSIGKTILDGLSDNEFETDERTVANYQGFDIILPAGMLKSNPFVYVQKNGKYKLEYKITDIGIMIRLNNLLDGLPKHLDELRQAKDRLEERLTGLKVEIEKKEDYGDKIALVRNKIKEIDKKLGVQND
jgi:superfamily II DNA/RNA helicase